MNYSEAEVETFLEALRQAKGIVTDACDATGVARSTHYEWLNSRPGYKEKVSECREISIDFMERCLNRNMEKGDASSIIFGLKCQGRSRGWRDRKEVEIVEKDDGSVGDKLKEILTNKSQK